MDVRCRVCGEPTDIDYFHDIAAEQGRTWDEVRGAFSRDGCRALGERHNDTTVASPLIGLATDLCGDDIDGLAADLEDAELLGWL